LEPRSTTASCCSSPGLIAREAIERGSGEADRRRADGAP
jgi:hypothetical protein